MILRTLADVREPISRVAGNTGLPVTDDLVVEYVNKAIEELKDKGDWPGVVDRWYLRFDETTGLVALPPHLERLVSVTVDDAPLEIRSPWFEFVQYGPGVLRDEETDSQGNTRSRRVDWIHVVADRGESPTRYDMPVDGGPYTLRVTALRAETADRSISVFGTDPDGHILRTMGSGVWQDGEMLTITAGTGAAEVVNGSTEFGSVTAVVKDASDGPIQLDAIGPTGTIVNLSTFEHYETNPTYRRYFIPALYRSTSGRRDRILLARCRRRFIPLVNGDERQTLMIGNLTALEAMVISQYKASIGAFDEAIAQVQRAVQIMKEDALGHSGRTRVPSMTFQRGFSIGRFPALR